MSYLGIFISFFAVSGGMPGVTRNIFQRSAGVLTRNTFTRPDRVGFLQACLTDHALRLLMPFSGDMSVLILGGLTK
jgi:hypothetical protein